MFQFAGCADESVYVSTNKYVVLSYSYKAERQRIYVFHRDKVFISDHEFPPHGNPIFKIADSYDVTSMNLRVFDELDPPFEPGGLPGSCSVYNSQPDEREAFYFDYTNKDAIKRIEQIDQDLIKQLVEVDEPPQWVRKVLPIDEMFVE
ncbi:MAG: hypothetical protein AAGI37_08910 [Planctomycetota bacterium]